MKTTKAGVGPSSVIVRPRSLVATIVTELEQLIVSGSIPLGSMLTENGTAERFGTSKTPVREAFLQLQAMGLVSVLPQKGVIVFRPTTEQVRELCELRLELEDAALRKSFERDRDGLVKEMSAVVEKMEDAFNRGRLQPYQVEDNNFHLSFFRHSGNTLLLEAYGFFLPRIRALRTNLSTPDPFLLKKSFAEHRQMLKLLRRGEVESVAEVLRQHIGRTQEFHTKRLLAQDEEDLPPGRHADAESPAR
jgi:DNA-binding GntR family transcriptional regulator